MIYSCTRIFWSVSSYCVFFFLLKTIFFYSLKRGASCLLARESGYSLIAGVFCILCEKWSKYEAFSVNEIDYIVFSTKKVSLILSCEFMEQIAKCRRETMRVLNLSLYWYLIIDFSIAFDHQSQLISRFHHFHSVLATSTLSSVNVLFLHCIWRYVQHDHASDREVNAFALPVPRAPSGCPTQGRPHTHRASSPPH